MKKEGDDSLLVCPDAVLSHFSDGLEVQCRGPVDDANERPVEKLVSNCVVFKKLRVAIEFRAADMHQLFENAAFSPCKPEIKAVFRASEHNSFCCCCGQLLLNFLKGLSLRFRCRQVGRRLGAKS